MNETDKKWISESVNVSPNAVATGSCMDDKESITLKWVSNSLTLVFNKTANHEEVQLEQVSYSIEVPSSAGDTFVKGSNHSVEALRVPLNHSFYCNANTVVLVNATTSDTVIFSELKLQAFMDSKDFSANVVNCEYETPDIVPIIVGSILAVLVIAVLVAYLISRRNSQARGYLSM